MSSTASPEHKEEPHHKHRHPHDDERMLIMSHNHCHGSIWVALIGVVFSVILSLSIGLNAYLLLSKERPLAIGYANTNNNAAMDLMAELLELKQKLTFLESSKEIDVGVPQLPHYIKCTAESVVRYFYLTETSQNGYGYQSPQGTILFNKDGTFKSKTGDIADSDCENKSLFKYKSEL